MRTISSRPRAVAWALALLVLLIAAPSAPAAPAAVGALAAPACLRTLSVAEWEGSFTFSYSGSASETDGESTSSASVSHSHSVSVRFTSSDPYDPSDFQQRWHGETAAGSIAIDNRGAQNSVRLITRGSGPPISGPGEQNGAVTVDVATCTYDIDVHPAIADVLNQIDDEPTRTDMAAFSFSVVDRPVNEGAGPGADLTLRGSASVPVAAAMETLDVDSAGLDGGHVAAELISIYSRRGSASAGTAAVTWTLRPIAPQPKITGLELLRQEYPSGEWVALGSEGVVDGDVVLMKVAVENPTGGIFQLPLRFLDGEAGQSLPGGEQQLWLPPGTTEAGYMWDTAGWTWEGGAAGALAQAGAPQAHPDRRIQVRLGTDANLYDQAERPARVRARPVVLVHGLNSNAGTWNRYPSFLREINFTWKAYPVHLQTGYDILSQQRSALVVENARTLADWVEFVRREEQSWHVDIVAHSMGGLIAREYIHSLMPLTPDERPAVGHLVMLGTPNRGSSCAYLMLGINLLHDIPNLLAPLELTPESVALFNQRVFAQKGTKFSVLVGDDNKFKCELTNLEPSDDVVLASSARYTFVHAYTDSAHTAMTASHDDFARFVMPMLLDRPHSARTTPNTGVILDAALAEAAGAAQLTQVLSRTVAPGASLELPLALPRAEQAAVTLFTAEGVAAALLDPAGATVATSAAGSPAARGWARSLPAGATTGGVWTLRLENQGAAAAPAIVAVQAAGAALAATAAAEPDAERRVALTLRLTDSGAPAPGATVTARVVGTGGEAAVLTLHDDGRHGDGAAGDGLYGARTDSLADGSYAALVSAQLSAQTRVVVVAFAAGAPAGAHTLFLPLTRR